MAKTPDKIDLSKNIFAKLLFPSIEAAEEYAERVREAGYIIGICNEYLQPIEPVDYKQTEPATLDDLLIENPETRKQFEDILKKYQNEEIETFSAEAIQVNNKLQSINVHNSSCLNIAEEHNSQNNSVENDTEFAQNRSIMLLIEEVFNFTFKSEFTSKETSLVYLEDVVSENASNLLEVLEQALFDRLVLEDPSNNLIFSTSNKKYNSHTVEKECIIYLFECYRRLKEKLLVNTSKDFEEICQKCISFIIKNVSTALNNLHIYESQDIHFQVINLFRVECGTIDEITNFLTEVTLDVEKEGGISCLSPTFEPILNIIYNDVLKHDVVTLPRYYFSFIMAFCSVRSLSEVFIDHSTPKTMTNGSDFNDTLLGAIFNCSCLPKGDFGRYDFFDKPLEGTNAVMEDRIWTATNNMVDLLHNIFLVLLKASPTCRKKTIKWIAQCLDLNVARGTLANLNNFSLRNSACVSDGFMLNLSAVLLRLAEPFTSLKDNKKLLRIDPTYAAASTVPNPDSNDDRRKNIEGVHMQKLSKETCLVSSSEGTLKPCSTSFSFITECFFMTHQALNLSFHVVLNKMQMIQQDLSRVQRLLDDQGAAPPQMQVMREQMELNMTRYLSMRCALLEPSTLSLLKQFHVATAIWLVQVAVDPDISEDRNSFAPMEMKEVKFPLTNDVPPALRCVPEMLLENLAHYLVLMKRFNTNEVANLPIFETMFDPILTELLVFMSDNSRATNPHLRARLAECLECLLPQEDAAQQSMMSSLFWENLFKNYPHKKQIVKSLLDVFVSIEMTGQSVTFEQKFNYRRPMYVIMKYLWNIDEQRISFKKLSMYAEQHMQDVNPPIYLRFINLLMNDAIFLLDEALSHMATLRTMQAERDSGSWNELPVQERTNNETDLQRTGMLARLYNILGKETILTLEYLTSETSSIFCHSTMVDRVASMLNYFLFHLVGPTSKNLKVKEQDKYSFEPRLIVLNICKIYIHLAKHEGFCAAIPRDGRSYKPELFTLAEDVLVRIGGSGLISDLQNIAAEVKQKVVLQEQEDEMLADVPDEFLDPIMSTVMTDPVTLPSSKQVVDRSTIARHLLSDQSDPFNRSLLTMDMVQPNNELKERIENWIAQRKNK